MRCHFEQAIVHLADAQEEIALAARKEIIMNCDQVELVNDVIEAVIRNLRSLRDAHNLETALLNEVKNEVG